MTFPVFASGDVLNASDMNAVGTWLVDSHSFSAVSSVTRSSVFTSNYTNYMQTIHFTSGSTSTSGVASIQFTVSGTATTANYIARTSRWYTTSWELTQNELGTDEIPYCVLSDVNFTRVAGFSYIFRPQAALPTTIVTHGYGSFGVNQYWDSVVGTQTDTTQFDGFKLNFPGNFSGVVRTYGLRG